MKQKTVAEIKILLERNAIDDAVLEILRRDSRKGVKQLLNRHERKVKKQKQLLAAQENKRMFDQWFNKEDMLLAGVDEAGRGPLAGPVTAAAVILPADFSLPGLTDSKQLTESERNNFYEIIQREALAYDIAIIEQNVIDQFNIYEATKMAMKEALGNLSPKPRTALIDAVNLFVPDIRTEAVIKGDDKSLVIAAASILAKVKRDEIMTALDMEFPYYEFAKNKGYGTKAHIQALQYYGPSPYHRKSFAPVSELSRLKRENESI